VSDLIWTQTMFYSFAEGQGLFFQLQHLYNGRWCLMAYAPGRLSGSVFSSRTEAYSVAQAIANRQAGI
jgi:hypothetical protein